MSFIFPTAISSVYQRLDPRQKRRFIFMIILAMINGVLDLLGIATLYFIMVEVLAPEDVVFTSYILDSVSESGPQTFKEKLVALMTILVGVFVAKNLIALILSRMQIKLAFSINQDLSEGLIQHHLWADAETHHNTPSSKAINRVSTVSIYLADTLIMAGITLISELFVAVLILVISAIVSPQMFVYLLITVVPVTLIILWFNRKKLRTFSKENNELIPSLYQTIADSIFGYEEIRLANVEERFAGKMRRLRDAIYGNRKKIIFLSEHYHFRLLETVLIFSLLIITIATGSHIELVSILTLYAVVAFRLIPSVSRIVGSANSLSSHHYIADMLKDGIEVEAVDPKKSEPITFNYEIALDEIDFSYQQGNNVLNSTSLSVKKGDILGLYGPSGAGKTTLLNIIMGFYLPSKGSVKIDGDPLSESKLISWQKKIAYVRQNAFLISGTIAENVAFGMDHSEADLQWIHTCLSNVGLWEWVETLPDRLHTNVGELGNAVSGGQRQRLAIARALYKSAEIVIFDEPTNSLDSEARTEVMSAIQKVIEANTTVIIVSHDDKTLNLANRLIEMKNGECHEKKP